MPSETALHHFWCTGPPGKIDRMWVEYYIDGESTPSIAFQPSMMCGLGFPTQIAKDFEYSAGGLCGKTAPVGGWSNTFPIPFYKSAVVTVRADPSDGAGCYGGYVSVRGTPRLPLVLPHSGLPLPTGSRLTLQRQPLALRQPLEFRDARDAAAGAERLRLQAAGGQPRRGRRLHRGLLELGRHSSASASRAR